MRVSYAEEVAAIELQLSRQQLKKLLANWPVGRLLFTRPGAGSANPAIIVVTERGQFFFKRRNERYCSRDQLLYDHAVMKHLAAAGLPVFTAVKTRDGSRWYQHDSAIYELYPYAAGTQHKFGDIDQVVAAGAVLADFHIAGQDFFPPGKKFYDRLHPPLPSKEGLLWAREQVKSGTRDLGHYDRQQALDILDYALASIQRVIDELPDEVFFGLPQTIVHGDWHPANLKFEGSRVVGIFDFDWVGRQPRIVDVVDGLLYFCSRRETDMVAADIRTLTAAFEPDWRLMGAFAAAYMAKIALTAEELAAIPNLMRTRWLYSRIFPMIHKIPEDEKIRYVINELDKPLQWIDANEQRLTAGDWISHGSGS